MNRFLSALSISLLLSAGTLTASGEISREGMNGSEGIQKREMLRGVKLPESALKQRPAAQKGSNSGIPELAAKNKTPRMRMVPKTSKPTIKAASKASSIEGYSTYVANAGDPGWYSIAWPSGSAIKWKRQGNFTPSAGFVRGEEIFAFYSYTTADAGLVDAGLDILDAKTGAVKESIPYDIFDTCEQVTVLSAYDSNADVAYVVTLDKTGKAHILQKFDPATRKFTNLGVNVPTDWLDMAWNPADESVYLFDEAGLLKKYDSKAKRFTQVNAISYDMEAYPNDMIYSPKDGAFLLLLSSYDSTDAACLDVVLLPVSGNYQYLGTLDTDMQVRILNVGDKFVNPDGVAAPVFRTWNFVTSATTGSFTVTLPSTLENGNAISGKVYLQVKMDGTELAGAYNGAAGADVTVPVTASEGMHRFTVTPYTLGDDGKIFGTPLTFDRCIGLDSPSAPTNVKLTETMVSWDPVINGANGGYVNTADIKYNVYVDKVLMTPTPVSATTLSITLPKTGAVAHRAQVFAVSGGKTSEAGVSQTLYVDGALDLPVYLGPEDGADDLADEVIGMFTPVKDALNREELRGWRYDDQQDHTGGFYCLSSKASSKGEINNEWLFLPAINFTDKDAHYRLSMEVWSGNHYFTVPETYEVALCRRTSANGAVMIKEAATVYKSPYFEQAEALFQVPEEGEWYIGIHYISPISAYRLYARNFRIEKADASSDSPLAVTDLRSTAADRGELKANLSFKMPVKSISGNDLVSSTVITATATSEAGTATVTGAPGETVSMSVPAKQGDNVIRVVTSSDKGQGMVAETIVYCGVYRPATPIVDCRVSDDNMKMTLEFELEDFNENGEFTGPDDQNVIIYRQVNGEWRQAADAGKTRTWEFAVPEETQALYMFGVGAKNAAGSCEEMFTFPVHLGKLHSLPMKETFNCVGDDVKLAHEPLSIQHLSYLQSTWGVTDPADQDETAANASGNAIACLWDGESQLLLPRFSTLGMNNVKLDLSMYFGNLAPSKVTVFASSPTLEMEPVASYGPKDGSGWESKLISLPAAFQNQGWVQVVIRVKIEGYSQCFLMESYSIADYPETMMTISGMRGASRGAVGEPLTYSVDIENAGTKSAPVPEYSFKALGDNGVICELKDENAPAEIEAGKKATLNFTFTPKNADMGDVLVRFNMTGQPAAAKTEIERNVTVVAAQVPVVQDLAFAKAEGSKDVALSWSKPGFVEGFEAAEPWDYSSAIRGFRNIDGDDAKVWGISEVSFPGEGAEKAFQVFSATITDNLSMAAHSGEQYLLCMSPKTGESDDWLISPEVKGGSKVSFWINICMEDYPETVLVKYSTTGNEPADFKELVTDGYVCPENTVWEKFEFTLPADAKYFALHHVGEDGSEQFGFMIDDISYEPADGAAAVEGYNLYRDDQLIAAGLTAPGYVDKNVDTSVPVRYVVKTLATVGGEKVESDRSNVVWVTDETSGVGDVLSGAKGIAGGRNEISIRGFETGSRYVVMTASGIVVATGAVGSNDVRVSAEAGVYMVKCEDATAKVIVK